VTSTEKKNKTKKKAGKTLVIDAARYFFFFFDLRHWKGSWHGKRKGKKDGDVGNESNMVGRKGGRTKCHTTRKQGSKCVRGKCGQHQKRY
jgi:hypothetical protein